jgi:hypothetical protein
MRYYQQAFELACEGAKAPECWYVALLEHVPYYGGPEEGGWWGTDVAVSAYREYLTERDARAAAANVERLAGELSLRAKRDFGEQCLRETDWLDARGLDADFLPEPDGEARYSVYVGRELPQPSYGTRGYS